jgi:hypothetical protein
VVLVQHRSQRPDACEGLGLRAYDVSHGRGGRRARSCEPPWYPPPHAGDAIAIAVTDDGAVAWIADGRLLVELDRGETIADLRAQRDAVAWTRGGVPSSAVPVG